MLTHLSLFTGIGGIDLGLDRAGIATVGQVEIDPYCRQVLDTHWPGVPRHADVNTFADWWAASSKEIGPVDVISAGFPCQPFSFAGKQRGTDDARWLWPQTAAAVRMVRPGYVLLENVAALVNSDAFGIVLSDLHALGFNAEWATLRASDFGAPHNRRRVYVLAYSDSNARVKGGCVGEGRDGAAPFTTEGLSGLAAPERRRKATAWIADEPDVARMANGVPGQLDRLRALGNTVVPAVAEHLGRLIVAHSAARHAWESEWIEDADGLSLPCSRVGCWSSLTRQGWGDDEWLRFAS